MRRAAAVDPAVRTVALGRKSACRRALTPSPWVIQRRRRAFRKRAQRGPALAGNTAPSVTRTHTRTHRSYDNDDDDDDDTAYYTAIYALSPVRVFTRTRFCVRTCAFVSKRFSRVRCYRVALLSPSGHVVVIVIVDVNRAADNTPQQRDRPCVRRAAVFSVADDDVLPPACSLRARGRRGIPPSPVRDVATIAVARGSCADRTTAHRRRTEPPRVPACAAGALTVCTAVAVSPTPPPPHTVARR